MNLKLWIPYFSAVFLVTALYILRFIRSQKAAGIPARHAWINIALESDMASGTTWVGTLGVVWLLGAVYINRLPMISDWLAAAPHHPALAFCVGFSSTAVSPIVLSLLTKRMFP